MPVALCPKNRERRVFGEWYYDFMTELSFLHWPRFSHLFPVGMGSHCSTGVPQIKGKSTGPQSGWILPPLPFPCLLLHFLPPWQKPVFKNLHVISGSSFLSFFPQMQLLLQLSAVSMWALKRSPLSYCTATKESPATDVPTKLSCK